jgi:hypothetical protein
MYFSHPMLLSFRDFLQLGDWYNTHICFGSVEDRKKSAKKNFPAKFSGITLILDGKVFPIRQFSRNDATTLYLPEVLTRKDYMCYKHKPPICSMLLQVNSFILSYIHIF